MKILLDIHGASVYRRVSAPLSWNKAGGKELKKGNSWRETYIVVKDDINKFEIYPLLEKNHHLVHWLVEHKILTGSGKVGNMCDVECIPLYPVDLIKKAADSCDYWIVKKGKLK